MGKPAGIPVAQYLRMSTEHQQYSLVNQSAAIERYAAERGLRIVRTYSDAAKSGLSLKHRDGLRQLLRDVVGPRNFQMVLVYDVSRWGRFQDCDEAAHYEYLCKASGAPVHYCAETFENDGSLTSLIMKALKRTMAAEYSRELSVKVTAGHKRLALLGFKQGGMPGYGLRRQLVGPDRKAKQRLACGERKSIATDRVVLVPGPQQEVRVVRRIYRLLLQGEAVYSIARRLNAENIPYSRGATWDYSAVYMILTHPKYCGCHVYGRTTAKLKTAPVKLPPSMWTLKPGAWEPLVPVATYLAAQQALAERTINQTDSQLLGRLSALLQQEGRLSLSLLERTPGAPTPSVIRSRFGGFMKACNRIGYNRVEMFQRCDLRKRTQLIRDELIQHIYETFPWDVSVVQPSGRWRKRVLIRGVTPLSVLIGRFSHVSKRGPQWIVDPVRAEVGEVVLLARLNRDNSAPEDLWLLPKLGFRKRKQICEQDAHLAGAVQIPLSLATMVREMELMANRTSTPVAVNIAHV